MRKIIQRFKALPIDERVLVVLLLITLLFGLSILLVTLDQEFAAAATEYLIRR